MVDSINGGTFYEVPEDIRPTIAPHTIEVLIQNSSKVEGTEASAQELTQPALTCSKLTIETLE